ncbi:MAG TPA: cytochrome b [Gallionellaceae bacterium]|jgi:cytochrome b561|nr:cytochrome b [Gallionellaceae bacterium]HQS74027.1 cytochrome b [Gallionellaceae bacterium]
MKQVLAYTRTAIALHWLIALLVFVTFPVGVIMSDMALSPDKLKLLSYHKWLGVTVFILLVVRLVWRVAHRPAPLDVAMPHWQMLAAKAVHVLLYVLLFAIPLSGWLMSSAKGFQTVYLGVLPLPDLLARDKVLGDALSALHQVLNITMLLLVIAHIAAALKHHFVDRDGTLVRMLPFLGRRTSK